ncbi:MAG: substrate-binding domain-containing protein, partial [Gammaproteobacteria bacterium]|nr:substrate-binding domain-containing protein [Gammaproteobacteria bacterium]
HEHIAYIGGPQTTSTGYGRYHALLKSAKKLGLDLDDALVINATAFSETAGAAALDKLLEFGKHFTAVLTANDLLALGCYDALDARGLQCPQDISITGFNDMPYVGRMDPPLTTLRIAHDALGVQAAQLLLERIENPDTPAEERRLAPELIVRGSTAPPTAP